MKLCITLFNFPERAVKRDTEIENYKSAKRVKQGLSGVLRKEKFKMKIFFVCRGRI